MRSFPWFRVSRSVLAVTIVIACGCAGPNGSASLRRATGLSQTVVAPAGKPRLIRSDQRSPLWSLGDTYGLPRQNEGSDAPIFSGAQPVCDSDGQCQGASGTVSFHIARPDTTTVPAAEYRNMMLVEKTGFAPVPTYAYNYQLDNNPNPVFDVRFQTVYRMQPDAQNISSIIWQDHDGAGNVLTSLGVANPDGSGMRYSFNGGAPNAPALWQSEVLTYGQVDTWEIQFKNTSDSSGWLDLYRNGLKQAHRDGPTVTTTYDILSFGIYYYNWNIQRSTVLTQDITFNSFDLSNIPGPIPPVPSAPTWHTLGGAASSIGAGPGFDPTVIGATPAGPAGNFALYQWAGPASTGSFSTRLAGWAWKVAVAPEGTVWALTADHQISRANAGGGYDVLPGSAREISVTTNGTAYVVGDDPYGPGNYGIHRWNGTTWDQVVGYASKVSVSSDGLLWAITADYRISRANSSGGYDVLPGAAYAIAAAPNGIAYVIGTSPTGPGGYQIYKYTGTTWVPVPGGYGVAIAVSPDGSTVYSLSADSSIRAYY